MKTCDNAQTTERRTCQVLGCGHISGTTATGAHHAGCVAAGKAVQERPQPPTHNHGVAVDQGHILCLCKLNPQIVGKAIALWFPIAYIPEAGLEKVL